MIQVTNLHKEFRVYRHHRGTLGSLRNLVSREYRTVHAVDGVTFHVGRGELIGYLGPNGAGKSTTIKMLTGILVPTSGEVKVGSWIPWRDRTRYVAHIGVVFGQRTTLWWDLPVIESLDLLRHIYRIPAERHRHNLDRFCELLELDGFLHTPVRNLSLGQRMRADLAASLLHDPTVVFLDEPTIGLDVVAKERIRTFIQQINQEQGTTIVLTTHDLGDVARLCQRVMIIDHGQLLFDGPLDELVARFGGERELLVDLAEHYPEVSVAGARVVEQDGRRVTLRFSRRELSASELIARISSRYRIRDLSVREPEIEETVRRIYENRLLDQGP
jgi:ABC-2 type transport system ATP-binding protein